MDAIDLFAGAGGFSEGAKWAGCRILWAANHWPAAVEVHAANHPDTTHITQDLHQADWTQVPRHDLLLASPSCQGHARARGTDKPRHDAARATAWAVVSALECHRTPYAIVENVVEFQSWTLYPAWCQALDALGYSISPHVLDAADHGVPQHRQRLFLVLSRSRWPLRLRLSGRRHVPARAVIDWGAGEWSIIDRPGRAAATLRRIANGRRQFGDRFLIPYYGSGSGLTGRSLDRPIGTITTLDRWAVIDGDRMRMLTVNEYRAATGFRPDYWLPDNRRLAIHLMGNAVCPDVADDLITALKAVS